ncbi:hypothetical protein BAUCODRAFT_63557 [Lecanosticta acicola]|uniref:MARVEL domain-containing protein n=1 Tax=Lecanosticta acicola TaxID=111012 RepID=A0AAI9E8D2_9PEZI|nr:hypothetical protein BAUCODRAFT_63557 [Lecanosticta acicola]
MLLRVFDRRGAKTAPSQYYPRALFHVVRCFQLISSLIVGGIMSFFIWHLTHDDWATPWTFIWLTAASLFSIAALASTILLHCCMGLHPRVNAAVNISLGILWTLSWSVLTWYTSGTLANRCDLDHWDEELGITVCRTYKALFTFTLLGMVSTIAALALDIHVSRHDSRHGIYRLHDLDRKRPEEATRGAFPEQSRGYGDGPRESEAWEAPRPWTGPYRESADRNVQARGYAVPDDQFGHDAGYHGSGGRPSQGQESYYRS